MPLDKCVSMSNKPEKAIETTNKDKNTKSCEVNNGLSVSTILDESQEAERIFAQFKQRKRLFKRNLIIEGSCNYFFWMDKIAMVSKALLSLYSKRLRGSWGHCTKNEQKLAHFGPSEQ